MGFLCINISQFIYASYPQWAFRLLPVWGYYKQYEKVLNFMLSRKNDTQTSTTGA